MRQGWWLGVAAMLLLAGCGERPAYDAAAVEEHLVASQADAFGGAEITGATCPADRELAEGMRLTCTLEVGGAELPYRVTLTDVHEDAVRVNAQPAGVLVSGAKLNAFVRTTLPKSTKAAQVDCGGAYLVAPVGTEVDCQLVLGPQERPITVVVVDAAGRVRIDS